MSVRPRSTYFWRIEREDAPPTVHQYMLGAGEHGEPTYVGHRAMLLDELLTAAPPQLG